MRKYIYALITLPLALVAFGNGFMFWQVLGGLIRSAPAEAWEMISLVCCPVIVGTLFLAHCAFFFKPCRRAIAQRHLFAATIALLILVIQHGLDSLRPIPVDGSRDYFENRFARQLMFLSLGAAGVTLLAAKIVGKKEMDGA